MAETENMRLAVGERAESPRIATTKEPWRRDGYDDDTVAVLGSPLHEAERRWVHLALEMLAHA